MKTRKLLLAMALGGAGAFAGGLVDLPTAHAQSTTTGAIQGRVTDTKTGESLAGVTIVATSGASSQTAITEDDGTYKITGLPPGDYLVTFFFGDTTIERKGVNVGVQKTTPLFQKIDTQSAVNETIVIDDKPPSIDPTSTSQGITIDREYTKNIPVPGRTFEAALGAAAGSQGDGLGVAFSGSSSLENQYYVDGVNTTSLRYGPAGSAVINDFIEEIEVITGGYNAEYGRATGAVVNVVTRSGTNDFEGLISFYAKPGFLVADRDRTPTQASSIDARADLAIDTQMAALISGPVIKDKLWFVVAAAPAYSQNTITRTTKRRVDCHKLLDSGQLSECDPRLEMAGGYADTEYDVDPVTGFYIYEELDTIKLRPYSVAANLLGKLNYALSPEQQGQLSINALPGRARQLGVYGLPSATNVDFETMTTDVSAKWTSKFNDNKTELEAVLGWHRDRNIAQAHDASARNLPFERLLFGNLGNWSNIAGNMESDLTRAGCSDGAGDKYGFIENCPDEGIGYRVGGTGGFVDDTQDRYAAKLSLTQRVKALGTHEIKAGLDIEDNRLTEPRAYTGGAFYDNRLDADIVFANLFVQVGPPGTTDRRFDRECDTGTAGVTVPCRYIGQNDEGSVVTGETINWAVYLRDSWQIRPNLTFNYGLRYEEQRLRFAEYLRDEIDTITGRPYGTNAMEMTGMWAPRVGLLYDWTREGRSKIYGHWGRFYESIPMNINSRSFAGEVNYRLTLATTDSNGNSLCGPTVPGYGGVSGTGCNLDDGSGDLIGAEGSVVAPGIKPQYMDETILGVEYELAEDLKIGVSYQNRSLGRVLEDVSTDNANTYIIANPGEWDKSEEDALLAQIEATDDLAEKARLQRQLDLFRGIRVFDKPVRDYHALQFTVTRRFSKALYMQGSYTFSKTVGNYPGLISYDNGQVDPNISSQYDLVELLANRFGPLPQDRPHYIKLDGYYQFDLKQAGQLTLGTRIRALSGTPRNVLAAHYRYGTSESFLLPRGEIGRTNFESSLDLHVGYSRKLAKGMELELYGDVFNVFDDQGVFSVDEDYTYRSASNPIVGGTYEDLIFAKEVEQLDSANLGAEKRTPVQRNPNFGNTAGRYAPLSAQFGARLTF